MSRGRGTTLPLGDNAFLRMRGRPGDHMWSQTQNLPTLSNPPDKHISNMPTPLPAKSRNVTTTTTDCEVISSTTTTAECEIIRHYYYYRL